MAILSPLGIALSMQPQQEQPTRPGVAPTDVIGAYKLATDAANTQYLAKLQQQNAMWGGLAGLGSAGLLAAPRMYSSGMLSGLPGLFGSGGSAAAGAGSDMALGGLGADAGAAAGGLGADAALGGTGAVLGDAGAIGGDLAGLGTVGTDLAAAAAPAAADAAAGFSLADILPFLLAA